MNVRLSGRSGAMQRLKPVVLWGVPVPMPLVSMYYSMLPFIQWFQRVTHG